MRLRQFFLATSFSVGLMGTATSPALAQGAPNAEAAISAGAAVTDPQGGAVGTITRVDGDFLLLRTDRHEVRLPRASFASGDGKVVIALTRDQLNAQVDRMLGQAGEQITAGATLRGRGGETLGTIESADAEFVTVKVGERLVKLPRASVAPGPDGPVTSVTAADLGLEVAGEAAIDTAAESGAAVGSTLSGAVGATTEAGAEGEAKAEARATTDKPR